MIDYIPLHDDEVEALGLPARLKTREDIASAICEICYRLTRLEHALHELDAAMCSLRKQVWGGHG